MAAPMALMWVLALELGAGDRQAAGALSEVVVAPSVPGPGGLLFQGATARAHAAFEIHPGPAASIPTCRVVLVRLSAYGLRSAT